VAEEDVMGHRDAQAETDGGGDSFAGERERILREIDAGAEEALDLARWMSAHPELSLEERATSERYAA
jgi:hypothetical protein